MNDKMIENLKIALDDIFLMSEEDLFKDFGKPESKYFFSELEQFENVFFSGDTDLFERVETEGINYKVTFRFELDLPKEKLNNFNDYDYACAA